MINYNRSDFELMAPVGSFESLMAAIQGGADAVYFGAEQLNMRAGSTANFTTESLPEISKIAHDHNIKTYLTINTVIYDREMEQMRKMIDAARENQITAIIASDLAAIQYAKRVGVEVHASTQLNISNFEAVKFFSQFCDVMVTARELDLKQVKYISDKIELQQIKGPLGNLVRIEVFVHGALCMAISGKCYLSLHENSHSANRGECHQLCRRKYQVSDVETGNQLLIDNEYIMSPKDLCTIGFIDKIINAGVRVFKIEGRARGPEYVKRTTECYNQAIHAVVNNDFNQELINELTLKLREVFNRDFWDGYYLGRRVGEWTNRYGSSATKRKVYVAKANNYFSKLGVAEFKMETGTLKVGDNVIITGPTTGVLEFQIEEVRVSLETAKETTKGDHFSIPVPELVRRGDKMYKLVDSEN